MIGTKIKRIRIQKGLTQTRLAGDYITRNMLSQIENGVANPSIGTVKQIADRLEVPVEYLMSERDDFDAFKKLGFIDAARKAFAGGEYARCLELLEKEAVSDDETELICGKCCLELGKAQYRTGKLKSAFDYFTEAIAHFKKSVYADEYLSVVAGCYINMICCVRKEKSDIPEAELYKKSEYKKIVAELAYIRAVSDGKLPSVAPTSLHSEHIRALEKLNSGKYREAEEGLKKVLAMTAKEPNAVLIYYVLCDLERCFTAENDYKNAYECANEKLSMLETMKK